MLSVNVAGTEWGEGASFEGWQSKGLAIGFEAPRQADMVTYEDSNGRYRNDDMDTRVKQENDAGDEMRMDLAGRNTRRFEAGGEALKLDSAPNRPDHSTGVHEDRSAPSSRASSVSMLGHDLMDFPLSHPTAPGGESSTSPAYAHSSSPLHSASNPSEDLGTSSHASMNLTGAHLDSQPGHPTGSSRANHLARGSVMTASPSPSSTEVYDSSSIPSQNAVEGEEMQALVGFLGQTNYNELVGNLDILMHGRNSVNQAILNTSESIQALEEQLRSDLSDRERQELSLRLSSNFLLLESHNNDLSHLHGQLSEISRRMHLIRNSALDEGHSNESLRLLNWTLGKLDEDLTSYSINHMPTKWGLASTSSQLPLSGRSTSAPPPGSFSIHGHSSLAFSTSAANSLDAAPLHAQQVSPSWSNMPMLSPSNMLPPQTCFELQNDFAPLVSAPSSSASSGRHHSFSEYPGAPPPPSSMLENTRLRRSSVPELAELHVIHPDTDFDHQYLQPLAMPPAADGGRNQHQHHHHHRYLAPKTPALPKVTNVHIDPLELVRVFIDDPASRYVPRINVIPFIRDTAYADDEDMPRWSPRQSFTPPISFPPLPPRHLELEDMPPEALPPQDLQHQHMNQIYQDTAPQPAAPAPTAEEISNWNHVASLLPPGALDGANGPIGMAPSQHLHVDHSESNAMESGQELQQDDDGGGYHVSEESGVMNQDQQDVLASDGMDQADDGENMAMAKHNGLNGDFSRSDEMSGFEMPPHPHPHQRKRSHDECINMTPSEPLQPEESPRLSKRAKHNDNGLSIPIPSHPRALSAQQYAQPGSQSMAHGQAAAMMPPPSGMQYQAQLPFTANSAESQQWTGGMARRSGLGGTGNGRGMSSMNEVQENNASAISSPRSPTGPTPVLDLSELAKPFATATSIKPRYLAIGGWHEDASETVSIVAKFHHAKKKLIWEVHDSSKGSSMRVTVHYGDVSTITVHDVLVGNSSSPSVAVNFSLNTKPKLECEAPTREHRHARTWVATSAGWTLGEADKLPQLHTLIFEKRIFSDRHAGGISHFERLIIGDPYFSRIVRIDSRYPTIAQGFSVVGRRTLEMLRDKLISFFELLDLYVRIYSIGQLSLSINFDVHHTYKNTDWRVDCGPHESSIAVNFEDISAIAAERRDTIMTKDEINYYTIITKVGENSICSFRQQGVVPTKHGGKLSPSQLIEYPQANGVQQTDTTKAFTPGSPAPTSSKKKGRSGRAADQPKNIRVAIMFSKARLMAVCGKEIESLWINHVTNHEPTS